MDVHNLRLMSAETTCLGGGTFQFVSVSSFAFSVYPGDDAALGALLGHSAYVNAGDSGFRGPFTGDRLTVDSFSPVDSVATVKGLRRWSTTVNKWSARQHRKALEAVYGLFVSADAVFSLTVSPDRGLGHGLRPVPVGGYHEFVLMHRSAGVITAVVASAD